MMNKEIKISVIMPVYNGEKYIKQAIESVINQSFACWELIIADDGSTDESLNICRHYAEADSRISIIEIPHTGVSAARNTAIGKAKGEWLSFIDCDDIMESCCLQELFAQSENADWVIGGYRTDDGENIFLPSSDRQIIDCNETEYESFMQLEKSFAFKRVWGALYRKSNIKVLFENGMNYGEDILFNFKNFKFLSRIATVEKVVYTYRINHNESSLSHLSLEKRIFASRDITSAILALFPGVPEIENYYLSRFVLRLYNHCVRLYRSGNIEEIKRLLSSDLLSEEKIRNATPPIKELHNFWQAALNGNIDYCVKAAESGKCFRSDCPGKISVVLPVYNNEETVTRSVESIIAQTYKKWELIICDDGSIDSTPGIIDALSEKDARIRVYHLPHGGVSAARNYGIEKAIGEWIAFLDGDDVYTPDAFETLITNSGNGDIVSGSFAYIPSRSNDKSVMPSLQITVNEALYGEYAERLWDNMLWAVVWNKLYRRSILNPRFDTSLQYGEDTVFNLQSARDFPLIITLDRVTYLYTRPKNGVRSKMLKGRLEILKTCLVCFNDNEIVKRKAFLSYARALRLYIAESFYRFEKPEDRKNRLSKMEKYAEFELALPLEKYLFAGNGIWWEQIKNKEYESVYEGLVHQLEKQGRNLDELI